jgi:hypothetical protein
LRDAQTFRNLSLCESRKPPIDAHNALACAYIKVGTFSRSVDYGISLKKYLFRKGRREMPSRPALSAVFANLLSRKATIGCVWPAHTFCTFTGLTRPFGAKSGIRALAFAADFKVFHFGVVGVLGGRSFSTALRNARTDSSI